jgi:hypothetical protein
MENELLKKNIMRRVHLVYLLRTLGRPLAYEVAFMAAVVGVSAFFVSLPNIYVNLMRMPSLGDMEGFIVSAFITTNNMVKILSVLLLGMLCVALYNFLNGLRRVTFTRVQNI